MRNLPSILILLALCAVTSAPLTAFEHGDFAPRGSLVYARVNDASKAVEQLGGKTWKSHIERMLLVRDKRDVEQSEVIVEELRRFADFFGASELVVADVMVRDPYVQSAQVTRLKEGAPKEFSQEFRDWLKKQGGNDAEITPTSIKVEGGGFYLRDGLLVNYTGDMIGLHIEDALDGFTEESLSQVERFKDWNENASGDIVAWADMKAWRTALDRLGEDFDDELRFMLDVVEWQKWDSIQLEVNLPRESSGGVSAELALYLNQPFERMNAFLKPTGGSRLVNKLPSETLGFLSMQLGRDHERTYTDILSFIHDLEQDEYPGRLRRRIGWAENDVERWEAQLKELQDEDTDNDEDGPVKAREEVDEEEDIQERIDRAKQNVERAKERLAELKSELSEFRKHPFDPERMPEKGKLTDAEHFHRETEQALEEFGFTHKEVLGGLGAEALMGFVRLPDPFPTENDLDAFEDMWFVLMETTEEFPELKDRFLDQALGRNLPDDATEEQRERAKRAAEETVIQKVDGGEIYRQSGLRRDFCFFSGEYFSGMAANEDVARLILKASLGQGRMGTTSLPGGLVSGSKFAYVNLRDTLQRIIDGEYNRHRQDHRYPRPYFDLIDLIPEGVHMSLATDESGYGVRFSFQTAGVGDLNSTLKMIADEMVMSENAYSHDRKTIRLVEDAVNAWRSQNREALDKMDASDRTKKIKGVTPESLIENGLLKPRDGLKSAFDPAMKERFEAMLAQYSDLLGADESNDASPTDLSESGYEWFGLPDDLAAGSIDSHNRRKSRGDRNAHVVMAMKGPWAHNGRFVVVWAEGRAGNAWFAEDDYQALRKSNTTGQTWTGVKPNFEKMPKWKVRKLLAEKQREFYQLSREIHDARERAKESGEAFDATFDGANKENAGHALREMLGLGEDSWWWFDDADNLTISQDAEGEITIRFEKWGHWIEQTDDDEFKSSLD